ncbi:VWA domain-containing protein [soil metagenome]
MPHRSFSYGRWRGGPDPLAEPYDVAAALDELGDSVLAGERLSDALRALLRQGTQGMRGLDDLRRQVRDRLRSTRRRGRLDGTLEQVRELLDRALAAERTALFPDPSDAARLAEAGLDSLPDDTAGAVRQLADYDWRSSEARAAYDEIRDLLQREVLDSSFRGMKQALGNVTSEDVAAMREMLADLGDLVEAHNRGEDTERQLADFLDKHGRFFPDRPSSVDELIDQLARRSAAQQRLLNSLDDEQRQELAGLMSGALSDMGLAAEMARLQGLLEQARPDLPWEARGGTDGRQALSLGDATSALEQLAGLEALARQLDQNYPGASLDDIDADLLADELGRGAAAEAEALRQLERELERQGWLGRDRGGLTLTPKAVRRLGATALRRVFAQLQSSGRGGHDVQDAGAAGELTGSTREWRFGDEQQLDVVGTVRNAVLRGGSRGGRVRLHVDDFSVVETERRTSAAVALLVDMSYSMELRERWGAAKSTAMALHHLVTTQYPQDAIEIIGFSSTARVLSPTALAELSWDSVQGTNLQHGLLLARRFLARHPGAEPVVLVVTDGEPTAHLGPDGSPQFWYPPLPETIALTLSEVDRCTRSGATINVFLLDDDPRLERFVQEVAHRNGGRVLTPRQDRLGEYVVQDYLRARRGHRARSA